MSVGFSEFQPESPGFPRTVSECRANVPEALNVRNNVGCPPYFNVPAPVPGRVLIIIYRPF